jgi:hypothetical protein
MTKLTKKLLRRCWKAGYNQVCIGVRDKRVRESMTFPFDVEDSIFASPTNIFEGGFSVPKVWGIVDELLISRGCGNSHQHNIHTKDITFGYYNLKALFGERK